VQVATIEMTLRYSHLSPEVGRSGVAARSAWQFHGNGRRPVRQLADIRGENWWRRRESKERPGVSLRGPRCPYVAPISS